MNTTYDLVVVIHLNPSSNLISVINFLKKFSQQCKFSYKVIVSDDSEKITTSEIAEHWPNADVLHTRKQMGDICDNYTTLSKAYSYALQKFDFKLLLKVEADALFIEFGSEAKALKQLEKNSTFGIAGFNPLHNETDWDKKFPEYKMLEITSNWKFIKQPLTNFYFRKMVLKAKQNGYKTGGSVLSDAYFMSKTFLEKLQEEKMLPNYYFSNLDIDENYLFSLLAKATDFDIINLSKQNEVVKESNISIHQTEKNKTQKEQSLITQEV